MVKKHGRFGGLPCRGARPVRDPPTLHSAAAAVPHALLRGDPPNLVADILREPEVAIRADGDAVRPAGFGGGMERAGEAAARRETPNAVAVKLGEPEVAIGPGRDALRRAPERGKRERGDAATGGKGLAKIKLSQR